MSILVLGGAGYIGSHAVDTLVNEGYDTVVVDSLVTGHRAAVNKQAKFYKGDILDEQFLNNVFEQEEIETVMHFAAFSLVSESMTKPLKYFKNNTAGLVNLLEVMKNHGVNQIVFSSTAATYGVPKELPITESSPTNPINPYGESKLMMEKIMGWADQAYGIKFVALRYFNVAGAKLDGSIGEAHHPETHLIPIILDTALGNRNRITIFGNNYNTKDGTNVRDYVHVLDLIDAHIAAMKYLQAGNPSNVFNLGSSNGFSNLEILQSAIKVTGVNIPYEIGARRGGDPDSLVAMSKKAREILEWTPRYEQIDTIISSAWQWHQKHPNGYGD